MGLLDKFKEHSGMITGGVLGGSLGGVIGYPTAVALGGAAGKRADDARKEESDINRYNAERRAANEATGAQTIEQLYGANAAERTGADVQDIVKRRREMLERPSGRAEAIRDAGSRQVANIREYAGKAGGAVAGGRASEQAQREASAEAARAQYEDYLANLGMFQETTSNVASSIPSIDLAYRQLGIAEEKEPMPKQVGLIDSLLGGLV